MMCENGREACARITHRIWRKTESGKVRWESRAEDVIDVTEQAGKLKESEFVKRGSKATNQKDQSTVRRILFKGKAKEAEAAHKAKEAELAAKEAERAEAAELKAK